MSTQQPDPERIRWMTAQINDLRRRLAETEEELLQERFRDMPPKYQAGDVVLVPRKLFGKSKLWPARINHVHRHYSEGADVHGAWVTRTISYGCFLQQADGSFGGASVGAYEAEIEELPVVNQ